MTGFKQYLDSLGIQLLYVNEPARYIDDSFYQEELGGEYSGGGPGSLKPVFTYGSSLDCPGLQVG